MPMQGRESSSAPKREIKDGILACLNESVQNTVSITAYKEYFFTLLLAKAFPRVYTTGMSGGNTGFQGRLRWTFSGDNVA